MALLGFAIWLSTHDKWNKQATSPFVSHDRDIRCKQLSFATDLKKFKAKPQKKKEISPVIFSLTQSLVSDLNSHSPL